VDQVRRNLQKSNDVDYRPFTLLIVDFNMPYLDGLQVVNMVKDLYSQHLETAPFFMMMTSNQEKEFRKKCLYHGVDFFGEKPCKEEKLSKILL